ncbi:tRNA threonylcarbamoyl adenosine modification protein (Sua5/YciO/YrdC/YwlC family) [Arcanobacterium wilhelmae]|uniref:L-threonylcarbamoyladenylate synthase n=1 Tax=Arcanobacterium wilhelmae TaxID=1803177 RepID=A0ABT9NBA8_9ACTO|nr:L-threonylcarbamoyladenylate synthase [Arcanobacterium wilhelmae]MDP9800511.1 tRNA threonylcarbamoyl adenosine modification protein (Sua5/YciO/YrdC/YwlC family) [Arcanobacterium wilhelmae]WFN89929.1 L-threonylcarbamoyladenylate synthase [Arcanobacterium wilhelmae]
MSVYTAHDEWLEPTKAAIAAGKVICLPTDTVYGVGANAFSADAVTALLEAKSRTRQKPPPVLVASIEQAQSLVESVPEAAHKLAEAFWPGALTIILPAKPTIGWDLGETNGTVALRMPNHPMALELLTAVGPLAVTSANITGQPPANTVEEARAQLGDAVAVYLDAGRGGGGVPSSIVRFNSDTEMELIRAGAIASADLERVSGLELA